MSKNSNTLRWLSRAEGQSVGRSHRTRKSCLGNSAVWDRAAQGPGEVSSSGDDQAEAKRPKASGVL